MLQKIPLLTVKATPRDGDQWIARCVMRDVFRRLPAVVLPCSTCGICSISDVNRKEYFTLLHSSLHVFIRLKEEYSRLIEYIKINKEMDNDWFKIESNKTGTRYSLV